MLPAGDPAGRVSPGLRSGLRSATARLLRDGSARTCVITLSSAGGPAQLGIEVDGRPLAVPDGAGVMSDPALAEPGGFPLWAVRRAVWFLVAIHLPFVVYVQVTVITRHPGLAAWKLALLAAWPPRRRAALQLRHSLAAAHGGRPRAWPLTFARWSCWPTCRPGGSSPAGPTGSSRCSGSSSAPRSCCCPRRLAALVAAASIAGNAIGYAAYAHQAGFAYPQTVLFGCYYVAVLVMGGGCAVRVGPAGQHPRRACSRPAPSWPRMPWPGSGSGCPATCTTCSARACRPCR